MAGPLLGGGVVVRGWDVREIGTAVMHEVGALG